MNGDISHALAGLQWELGLPGDGARTCAADFTIDDLRLVAPVAASVPELR